MHSAVVRLNARQPVFSKVIKYCDHCHTKLLMQSLNITGPDECCNRSQTTLQLLNITGLDKYCNCCQTMLLLLNVTCLDEYCDRCQTMLLLLRNHRPWWVVWPLPNHAAFVKHPMPWWVLWQLPNHHHAATGLVNVTPWWMLWPPTKPHAAMVMAWFSLDE